MTTLFPWRSAFARALSFVGLASAALAQSETHDVVVYGGTSGGVVAAVQAARSGRDVVLVSPKAHLGGMTSSGLGWTDLGSGAILGGLSREFYHRVYEHYQDDAAWDKQSRASYGNAGQGGPAFDAGEEIARVFEPKVAEDIFDDLIAEAGVTLVTGRVDLDGGVIMEGERIDRLRLEGGGEIAGRMFIDASYEGDLLSDAGVTFTVGRESNEAYDETLNGIQTARAVKNQLVDGIDPHIVPGDPPSGLLPGVNADAGGPDGSGDDRLQAYCYRMVLTDIPENRVMIPRPDEYDEDDYELVFRSIERGQTSGFFKLDLMPNRKTDSNNTGGISTDLIGGNYGPDWDWTMLDHDERAAVAAEHERWQRGLVWTLQNHPRVPGSVRDRYARWGLPADEFPDNGHWPYQLYIREGRRMVSDLVMTEDHCAGARVVRDSIGLAAYTMDSHNVQRHVDDGMVRNEGDVQRPVSAPYPVSYRAIVPKRGECRNLLVPWSLSATHIAFGSIRMEPVFMILAQSAAVAADLALEEDSAVQEIDYGELREALEGAGQELGEPVTGVPEVIVDNGDEALVSLTGDWLSSSSTTGFVGVDYLHDDDEGKGDKEVFFRAPPEVAGVHAVFIRWTSHANRASNAPVAVRDAEGNTTMTVDQRANGGSWRVLGFHEFAGGADEGVTVSNAGTDGYVVADAVGFLPIRADTDSDGDGMNDVRELELDLDPFSSDEAFIDAVREHPGFFGLHAEEEIHDLRLTRPAFERNGASGFRFGFGLETNAGDPSWRRIEDVVLEIPEVGGGVFYRLALATGRAGFSGDP